MKRFVSCLVVLSAMTSGCGASFESENETDEVDVAQRVDSLDVHEERPLLVIRLQAPGTSFDNSEAFYERRIFGGKGERNVRDYFLATSNNKFTFKNAGIVTVLDDPSVTEAAGSTLNDAVILQRVKRARYLAEKAGVDFRKFDANGNGSVEHNELSILVVDTYSIGNGKSRREICSENNGIVVCAPSCLAGHHSRLVNYAHELSHGITKIGLTKDLYGASGLNQDLTLMAGTASNDNQDADTRASFLDPYHRERFGWYQERVKTVDASSQQGGPVTVGPLGGSSYYQTLKLISGDESLTFELRIGRNYDDFAPIGLYAWHADLDADGLPKQIPSLTTNGTDASVNVLAATHDCRLDMNHHASRGVVKPLWAGEYVWNNRHTGGTKIVIEPVTTKVGTFGFAISWQPYVLGSAGCGASENPVTTVYEHIDLGGKSHTFGRGNFDVGQLKQTIGNDTISSLNNGPFTVTFLCEDAHGMGECEGFWGYRRYVGDDWNDRASFLQVLRLR